MSVLTGLSSGELLKLQKTLTPKTNKYIPIVPTIKQAAALLMNSKREMLYGGAAGGGKSVWILAAALQYVDQPHYNAILFRKTFADLMLPGALIPMSQEWLSPWMDKGLVTWKDKEKRYTFEETGATLSFGYLDAKGDFLRYQGSEFQFVGMDEVTHIDPEAYRYLFSRLRRVKGVNIPIRMRATANPGGTFGDYYYDRFFVDNPIETDGTKKRVFLAAGLKDNPFLDADEYRQALAELDPITREQLENGNWEIRPKGDLFNKDWLLSIAEHSIPSYTKYVRFWDLASIDPKYRKKTTNTRDPDSTVGFKLGMAHGCYYITDIIKEQLSPGDIEVLIRSVAEADGHTVAIRMEEEGGSSGAANILRYSREILPGFDFAGVKPVISKIERARPVAAAMQVGNVFIRSNCRNLLDFYTQLEAFPTGAHDDIVDGLSGAFSYFIPSIGAMAPPPKQDRVIYNNIKGMDYSGSYWHTMR